MRKGWVIAAAVLGGAAGAAQAADVQMFGIHSPSVNGVGRWAVYARISNATSVEGGTVSGLSSLGVDILNQTTASGSATVQSAFNGLPFGTTKYVDPDLEPQTVGYGFWLVRSDGQPFTNATTGESGIAGISGAQNALIAPPSNGIPFENFVIQGVGQTRGTIAADPPGGDKTSSTSWTAPVIEAQGSYTPSAVTGPGSQVGLKIRYFGDSGVNLLKVDNPGAGVPWKIEGAATATVIDARNFIRGTNLVGDTTVKAGPGDANLDNVVDFNDLVLLAQNYNTTNTTWFQGDFNYDGLTDFNDLVLMAQSYNTTLPGAPLGSSASFQADFAAAMALAPEPGSVGVVCVGAVAGLIRRKRK
jgi:hypothetical protein